MATDVSMTEGARSRISTGLELRVKLPGAAVGMDALRDVTGAVHSPRLRLFFASLF